MEINLGSIGFKPCLMTKIILSNNAENTLEDTNDLCNADLYLINVEIRFAILLKELIRF